MRKVGQGNLLGLMGRSAALQLARARPRSASETEDDSLRPGGGPAGSLAREVAVGTPSTERVRWLPRWECSDSGTEGDHVRGSPTPRQVGGAALAGIVESVAGPPVRRFDQGGASRLQPAGPRSARAAGSDPWGARPRGGSAGRRFGWCRFGIGPELPRVDAGSRYRPLGLPPTHGPLGRIPCFLVDRVRGWERAPGSALHAVLEARGRVGGGSSRPARSQTSARRRSGPGRSRGSDERGSPPSHRSGLACDGCGARSSTARTVPSRQARTAFGRTPAREPTGRRGPGPRSRRAPSRPA